MKIATVALAALVTGCAPVADWVPTQQTLAQDAPSRIDGHIAAGYDPTDGVPGEVRVAVVGTEWFANQPVLHVRLLVRNRSEELWSLDGSQQLGAIGEHSRAPVLVIFDGSEVSTAVVMPGENRTGDLYFALPDAQSTDDFRLDWRVATPTKIIAARKTAFERRFKRRPKVEASPLLSARTDEHDPHGDGSLPRR